MSFTSWLAAAGGSGKTLDLNSIRVVEYSDAARTVLAGETPCQFDPAPGFDAKTNAAGELVWLLQGQTNPGATRYFRVYFDATENGSKPAPSYSTGLSWNAAARTVETPGVIATYSQTKAGFVSLQHRLSGSPKLMWNASDAGYPFHGSWHTINEAPWWVGWIDDFGGASTASHDVVAGPVRITITTQRDEGKTFWTIVRRFYAGSPPSPYIRVSVKAEANPHDGSGILFLKRVVWSQAGAPAARTVYPPDNFGGTTTHDVVFDFGEDGGVGVASSFNFAPNSSEDYEVDAVLRQAQFDCWGETWLMGGYPVTMDYALAVHNETTQSGAEAAMTGVWRDYNEPVSVVVHNEGTVQGVVTDASTAQPVRNAIVRLRSGSTYSRTVRSSATGHFRFTAVPAGTAAFSVKADGYAYYSANVSVAPGANTVNASLQTNPSINLRSTALGGSVDWLLGMDVLAGGPVVPPGDDFSAPGASEAGFIPTEVPSNWDIQQGAHQNLYGWYRTRVEIPGTWAGNNLRLRNFVVEDVDATYFNGVKVGQTGKFPDASDPRNPDTSIRKTFEPRVYWIPASAVQFGTSNVIAIRAYDADAFLEGTAGGLTVARPILEIAPPTAVVSGFVTGPGGPISGAEVEIVGVGRTTTAANGSYSFPYVLGDVYQLKVTAFGYKPFSQMLDVPDSGTLTKNVTLESAGCVAGKVTRNGAALRKCRVYWSGPSTGSILTDDNGDFSFSALPGEYTVVFNALKVKPRTVQVSVSGPTTLNVDLPYGVTPIYDGFAGASLDMSKWEFANLQAAPGAGNALPTVSGGVLKLEMAPNRGGIMSTSSFGPVSCHEVIFARPYVGTNQIMNLYGGTGGFGNFVEIANEGFGGGIFAGIPRVAVYGTARNPATLAWAGYPMSCAIVRTYNYYDFYIDGIYYDISDTSNGLTTQNARIYLYGWENTGGETIGYFSAVAAGTPVEPQPATLGQARQAATGTPVIVSNAVVTASFGEAFWIQNPDRSAGIKVMSATILAGYSNPAPGSVVTVVARVVHVNNEAVIQRVDHTITGNTAVPEPLMVINRPVGAMDASGAAVQGLRVSVFGKVTGLVYDSQNNVTGFFLDDGSNLPGDGTRKGLYVPVSQAWLNEGFQPPFGPEIFPEWATVTGVVTVSTQFGEPIPAIRAQHWTDINVEFIF